MTAEARRRSDAESGPLAGEVGPNADADAHDRPVGILTLGSTLVALPIEALREVVPSQSQYRPLAVSAKGLLGAISLRGVIIPVLDLGEILGMRKPPVEALVIVIMRCDGRLVGLEADGVRGIARVYDRDLHAFSDVGKAATGDIATHSFEVGGDVVTLLDAKRIAALPGIPSVAEIVKDRLDDRAIATRTILLLSCGSSHLAIDATCVDATVPRVQIRRNALSVGDCLGVIDHHGQEVPVVDTSHALGLGGSGEPRSESAVVVLRFPPAGLLGFVLDEVRDIVRAPVSRILPMPEVRRGSAPGFRGVFSDDGGRPHLLIDPDALRADPALAVLAGLCKARADARASASGVASETGSARRAGASARALLTYRAGGERASPLTQISEIIKPPDQVAPLALRERAILGVFTHRGRVLPLVCLTRLLGRPGGDVPTADWRVLIVDGEDGGAGFMVEELRSIEVATEATEAPPPGDVGARRLFEPLVSIGAGANRRMIAHVDLTALLRALAETTPPPAVLAPTLASAA